MNIVLMRINSTKIVCSHDRLRTRKKCRLLVILVILKVFVAFLLFVVWKILIDYVRCRIYYSECISIESI